MRISCWWVSVTKNNLCSCGCGYEVGSTDFQELHVDQQKEAERRANEEYYTRLTAEDDHGPLCFCTRCDG
ncbi:MAG TPA: hypothetical protein ENI23_11320 [bacterium]|nr:hypothetical protein [bacterium]